MEQHPSADACTAVREVFSSLVGSASGRIVLSSVLSLLLTSTVVVYEMFDLALSYPDPDGIPWMFILPPLGFCSAALGWPLAKGFDTIARWQAAFFATNLITALCTFIFTIIWMGGGGSDEAFHTIFGILRCLAHVLGVEAARPRADGGSLAWRSASRCDTTTLLPRRAPFAAGKPLGRPSFGIVALCALLAAASPGMELAAVLVVAGDLRVREDRPSGRSALKEVKEVLEEASGVITDGITGDDNYCGSSFCKVSEVHRLLRQDRRPAAFWALLVTGWVTGSVAAALAMISCRLPACWTIGAGSALSMAGAVATLVDQAAKWPDWVLLSVGQVLLIGGIVFGAVGMVGSVLQWACRCCKSSLEAPATELAEWELAS